MSPLLAPWPHDALTDTRLDAVEADATTEQASLADHEQRLGSVEIGVGRVVRPEGATNDSDNIHAALAGAGKVMLQPGGAYAISASVPADLPSGWLDLNRATLRLVDGANQPVITHSGEGLRIAGPGTIDGNCDNQTTAVGGNANGINVTASSAVIEDGIDLINCRNQSLRLDPTVQHVNCRFLRLRAVNCLDHAFHFANMLGGLTGELIVDGSDRAGVVFSGGCIGTSLVDAWLNATSRAFAGQAALYWEGAASQSLTALGIAVTNAFEYAFRNEPGHKIPGSRLQIAANVAGAGVVLTGAEDWDVDSSVYNTLPDADPQLETDGVNLILCKNLRVRGRSELCARSGYLIQGCSDIDLLVAAKNCGQGAAATLLNGITLQDHTDGTPNTRIAVDGVFSDDQAVPTQEYGLRAKNAVVGGLRIGPQFTAIGNKIAPYTILAGTRWISSPHSPTRVPFKTMTLAPGAGATAEGSGVGMPGFGVPFEIRAALAADPNAEVRWRASKSWNNVSKTQTVSVTEESGAGGVSVNVEVYLQGDTD